MCELQTLCSYDTIYSADSVEWCPIEPYQNIFICGTYQLNKDTEAEVQNKREGYLYLFTFNQSNLLRLQRLDIPAVLDSKWCHVKVSSKILLAVATAAGEVTIFSLEKDSNQDPRLVQLTSSSVKKEEDNDCLALSLDWSTGRGIVEDVCIAVSDSKGCVNILQFTSDTLVPKLNWKAHNFEAWIVEYDYWNNSVLFTGGDDCKLLVFDVRSSTENPVFTSRAHSAGVTCLRSSEKTEHTLLSGSYDEELLLWDTRQMRRPICNINVGGGVWRIKWKPNTHDYILVAAMYNGFKILNDKLIVETCYDEHESIAYGADWSWESGSDIVATCSFYDHKLCISKFINKQTNS